MASESDSSECSEPEISVRSALSLGQPKGTTLQDVFNNFVQADAIEQDLVRTEERLTRNQVNDEDVCIINKAREYQQELYERAKEENVIAVLDTGSGKTLISCLLIRDVLTQELIDRANGKPPKLVFFLANSVHLVQQQARVLASNLSDAPAVFVGSDRTELWKKDETWTALLEKNTPIVCTPAILQQCLDGAIIKITQISLLVFDEAHHAKKSHPYSRIIRSHYLKCLPESQPKIFGMTASPVDSKGNIDTNATDLEQLLDSKIVTTSDMSILSFAPKPRDIVWRHPKPSAAFETDLHRQLWSKSYFAAETRKGFEFSKRAVTELGPWCADRVWKYVFEGSEHSSSGMVKRFEQGKAYARLESTEEREAALSTLEEAALLIVCHDYGIPTPSHEHLSPKVLQLYDKLVVQYTTNPNTRAIVFVDQRFTAHVLCDCFRLLNVPNLRPGTLLGTSAGSSAVGQQLFLEELRAGLVNLVFATSVADEGIDIPQCNLCVRFDLYKTPIQYMQSRGRARMRDSVYIHMVQQGDPVQEHAIRYAMESDRYIRDFCQSLPIDRLLGRGTKLDRLIRQDSAMRCFNTAKGAICDFGNSLLVLSRFASSLHHLGALEKESYVEEVDIEHAQFRYVVKLPPSSGMQVPGAKGEWRQNKQLAKRSAAFNCCFILRRKGLLDDSLNSVFQKVKPQNLCARLAVSEKKSSYPMQVKPTAWSRNPGDSPRVLFACILKFEPERELQRPLSPLVVLTREPLPNFPAFPVFCEDNNRTLVMGRCYPSPFEVTMEEIELLTKFTLAGVFSDVFKKSYELDPTKMAYWLAPSWSYSTTQATTLSELVDIDSLRVAQSGRVRWTVEGHQLGDWTNKFVCDPRNAKYNYFTSDIVQGVTVFDPEPAYVPSVPGKGRDSIIDFSDSSWKASKKKFFKPNYDPAQPVISAELFLTRRNFLEQASEKERMRVECYIAPQPLEASRLAPEFAASCFLWPVIIHRIESYMITMEAFDRLGLPGISADLALQAFTKDGEVDESDVQTYTRRERGMGKNYERLEFIGDSLLKMMTTITVFNRTTCDEEGMHCRRMEMLCNRRLFDVSTEKHHLYQYARTSAFNRVTWYPENLILLKGRGVKSTPEPVVHGEVTQELGMKTIADISEAIIGAAITASRGSENELDLGIQAVTTLVDHEDHAIKSWSEISAMYNPPEWSLLMNDVQANKLAKDLEGRTMYKFKHPRLLRSAFTHSSDSNATVPDLQRLEFLGDAVLDWVSISWLFFSNPDRNPQWLTEHKMAMVSNKFLAALAVVLDFDKFIFCSTTRLYADITTYAHKVREAISSHHQHEGSSNDKNGNNDDDNKTKPMLQHLKSNRDFWTRIDSPPKALSDLVESYLGALLIDSDWNLGEVQRFFTNHMLWFFEEIETYDTFANRHPTSYLYKKFQDDFKCRDFQILCSDPLPGKIGTNVTAGVLVHGNVIATSRSSGSSRTDTDAGNNRGHTSAKYAKVKASKNALDVVEGMTPQQFRNKFGCTCSDGDKKGVSEPT